MKTFLQWLMNTPVTDSHLPVVLPCQGRDGDVSCGGGMIDLMLGAQPYERFHLQYGQPKSSAWIVGPFRRTRWHNLVMLDGSKGTFISWWLWNLQWYHGTVKCDGTRTKMAWAGQLGDPTLADQYVMTTTPKEMSAFRWRTSGPSEASWDGMGGS